MEPIRVLHIVGAMYPGGFENFIMNLYENIDRDKIQFDIIIHMRKEGDYVEKIESMGGRVYELPRLTKHPWKNLKGIFKIVKENKYPVVIRHTSNALVAPQLLAARMAGAYTICHSHNETDPQKTLHKLGKILMPVCVKARIACSPNAGYWMFGKKAFEVIHNAISIEKFQYDKDKAQKIDQEFSLEGKHVYGHIANFIDSKNHLFLLSVFKEISKMDSEARFFCVGEGNLRPMIEQEIEKSGLQDVVTLTGIRKDVENFMSRFDVLIFPSKFEGLPLTLIEAQSAGLPCLISDTITDNVIVTKDLVEKKSLEASAKEWATRAMQLNDSRNRECQRESIAQAGYDIKQLAKWYEEYMLSVAKA